MKHNQKGSWMCDNFEQFVFYVLCFSIVFLLDMNLSIFL